MMNTDCEALADHFDHWDHRADSYDLSTDEGLDDQKAATGVMAAINDRMQAIPC
jgi:hypothetical protein